MNTKVFGTAIVCICTVAIPGVKATTDLDEVNGILRTLNEGTERYNSLTREYIYNYKEISDKKINRFRVFWKGRLSEISEKCDLQDEWNDLKRANISGEDNKGFREFVESNRKYISCFLFDVRKRLECPEIVCLSKKIKYIDEQIEKQQGYDKQFEELQKDREQLENGLDRLRW